MKNVVEKKAAEIIEEKYRSKYKDYPLENIIVFRSGPMRSQYIEGTDFFDNSRALFEYMLENGYNEKYELVWLVKNPNDFLQYKKYTNVKFLSFEWEDSGTKAQQEEYYRVLCLAKYIFFTDTYGFALNSRKEQIRIQLWHGCGFKTRLNFGRCESKYDYTTVISQLYADIHQKIYGLRTEQVIITGYAKHDWLFKPYNENLSEIFNCPLAKKYIFWLPTFRTTDEKFSHIKQYELNPETGLPIIENINQMKQLNNILVENDMVLIVKLHPFQKKSSVKKSDCSNIKIIDNYELYKKDLVINRLLASADALISDYSSAAVDFLNKDKPIAFTLDDVEEYEDSRGFVFKNIKEWLPGTEIYDYNDMCRFIGEIASDVDSSREKRNKISTEMIKYRDCNNCKRICEAFNI